MAEKYGTVPPKFTKAWWEYFWLYYKWHTLITLFVVVCVVTTIYQRITAVKYDITLTYAGYSTYSEETINEVSSALSPLCEDVDENGETNLYFSVLSFLPDDSDPNYNMAMYTKLQLSLSADEAYLYIIDEELVDTFIGDSADNATFVPLEKWYKGAYNPDTAFSRFDKVYGIRVSDCKMLKDIFKDSENKYLIMRYYPRNDQKKQIKGYNAAAKLGAQLIG